MDIPQKHIEALERINAITITDRLTYNLHKQSKNAEEVSATNVFKAHYQWSDQSFLCKSMNSIVEIHGNAHEY